MEWEKAKTFLIIMLIILNIGLFALNYFDDKKYHISESQIESIDYLYEKYNISSDVSYPETFYPLPYLKLSDQKPDSSVLTENLFGENELLKRTSEQYKTVFKSDTKTLTIDNSFAYFVINEYKSLGKVSIGEAKDTANEFIRKLGEDYSMFVFDYLNEYDDASLVTVYYVEEFKGFKIFSNTIEMEISTDGIVQLIINRKIPIEFEDINRDISSPDEAVLSLIKKIDANNIVFQNNDENLDESLIENNYLNENTAITNFELGYYEDNSTSLYTNENPAYPAYRIIVENHTEPYIINGYLNSFVLNK